MPQLPPEDRIGLLSDTYALCKAGHMPPPQLIDLLSAFATEDNDKVWTALSVALQGLARVVGAGLDDAVVHGLSAFAAKIVGPQAARIGWDHKVGDSENTKKLRQTIVGLVATFCAAEPAAAEEARSLRVPSLPPLHPPAPALRM